MKRQRMAIIAVVAMFALAGCADGAVTTTVDSDGEIEQIQIEAEMSQEAYGVMLEEAGAEGHDSVSGLFAAEFDDGMGDGMSDFEHEDRRDDGMYIIEITANDVGVEELDGIETEQTNEDTIRYTADSVQSATIDEMDGMTYQVEMPGEITETNADEVDKENNVAVWDVHTTDAETAVVESEQSSFSLWTAATVIGVGVIVLVGGLFAYWRLTTDRTTDMGGEDGAS